MDAALLSHIIRTAADASRNEAEFIHMLGQQGFVVRHRFDAVGVRAYAVSLPTPDTPERWFETGDLAADLTLSRLRARWLRQESSDDVSNTAGILGLLAVLAIVTGIGSSWVVAAAGAALLVVAVVVLAATRPSDGDRYRIPEAHR